MSPTGGLIAVGLEAGRRFLDADHNSLLSGIAACSWKRRGTQRGHAAAALRCTLLTDTAKLYLKRQPVLPGTLMCGFRGDNICDHNS